MKDTVNLFGSLDGYDVQNVGWINVGGRFVSYGNQSPEDDDSGQWFQHYVGDWRQYMGDDTTTIGWRCTVGGVPGTWEAISGGSGPSLGFLVSMDAVVDLRDYAGPIGPDFLFWCRGYLVRGDGGEGFYRLDFDHADDQDDGVLTFQLNSNPTGPKFKFQSMGNTSVFKAQRCGTPVTAGPPRYSFDQTGAVIVGSEMSRVTGILRGVYGGLQFGEGTFQFDGSEFLHYGAENVGFELLGSGNTIFFAAPSSPRSVPLNIFAMGAEGSLTSSGYGIHTWTQTISEGESVFPGVAAISSLAVGDTVLCRFGADNTDTSGIWFTYVFSKIKTITPDGEGDTGTVEIESCCPEQMPANAGSNPSRVQTIHDMMVVTQFQDNVSVRNIIMSDVIVSMQFYRNLTIDCVWKQTKGFCLNGLGGLGLRVPNMVVNKAPGGDIPAGLVTLASQHDNWFGTLNYDINPVGGVVEQIFSNEAQCRGTRIDHCYLNVKSATAAGTTLVTFGQTPGQTDMISVGHLQVEGGAYQLAVSSMVHVETLDRKNSTNDCYVSIRGDQVDNVITNLGFFRNSRTIDVVPLPISRANTVTTYALPLHGLTKSLRLKASALIGITAVDISGDGFVGTNYAILSDLIAGSWVDINQAAILGLAAPNSIGYNSLTIRVTTDGTAPAGVNIAVEHNIFEVDLSNSAFTVSDNSLGRIIAGDGAPAANAGYLGQVYFDQTTKIYYDSVAVGGGAADWVRRGVSQAYPTLIDAHAAASGTGTYNSPAWTAGQYSRIQVVMKVANGVGDTGSIDHILLVGPGGTYNFTEIFIAAAAGPVSVFNGTGSFPVNCPGGTGLAGIAVTDIAIPTAAIKTMAGKTTSSYNSGAGFNQIAQWAGSNDDAVNGVTGISLVWAAISGPWSYELWGWP